MKAVVPFMGAHLSGFKVHGFMSHIQDSFESAEYRELLEQCIASSYIVDGETVAACGIYQAGEHRWIAWGLLSEESGKHMLAITRALKAFFNENSYPRIETPVLHDFELGHKWMKMLGFKNETPDGMKSYGDNGETYDLYARCA